MLEVYCYWKEISVELYKERRGFKVNAQFYALWNEINKPWSCDYHGSSWKWLTMFDILRAGNGAWFTVANKNEFLEITWNVATEAVQSRPSTTLLHSESEEVGHDFHGMCILLSHIICNVLFLLTQQVDLGCVGVHCSLWQTCSN